MVMPPLPPTIMAIYRRQTINSRLEDGSCSLVLEYKVEGESLALRMLSSTCDEVPSEPIPDFMYSAVFGESFERQA